MASDGVAILLTVMSHTDEKIRIFVGAHTGEQLPYRVLEHSIRRHASLDVEMRLVDNSLAPEPPDARFLPYTNFSFGRFAIPKLAGHAGRAIYLDSDMLVFRDIAELWNTPFEGAKILIEQITPRSTDENRRGAVLLLDCAALQWDPERIIKRLGIDYDYDQLMTLRPLLEEGDLRDLLPYGWNSLDERNEHTRLLHYTRIKTQPWVHPAHPLGGLWVDEVRLMLETGATTEAFIRDEVAKGHVRPSLLSELGLSGAGDERRMQAAELFRIDEEAGFVIHAELFAALKRRKLATLAHEEAVDPSGFRRRRLRRRLRRFVGHPVRFLTDPDRRL